MAGIMNTLWDESSELADEALTPHSILSDDYITQGIEKSDEIVEEKEKDEKVFMESLKNSLGK